MPQPQLPIETLSQIVNYLDYDPNTRTGSIFALRQLCLASSQLRAVTRPLLWASARVEAQAGADGARMRGIVSCGAAGLIRELGATRHLTVIAGFPLGQGIGRALDRFLASLSGLESLSWRRGWYTRAKGDGHKLAFARAPRLKTLRMGDSPQYLLACCPRLRESISALDLSGIEYWRSSEIDDLTAILAEFPHLTSLTLPVLHLHATSPDELRVLLAERVSKLKFLRVYVDPPDRARNPDLLPAVDALNTVYDDLIRAVERNGPHGYYVSALKHSLAANESVKAMRDDLRALDAVFEDAAAAKAGKVARAFASELRELEVVRLPSEVKTRWDLMQYTSRVCVGWWEYRIARGEDGEVASVTHRLVGPAA